MLECSGQGAGFVVGGLLLQHAGSIQVTGMSPEVVHVVGTGLVMSPPCCVLHICRQQS
jgi:hypothetical protein